jgi:ElaB/YqjD/DUF883 family membrane-anchored ribosome-binding protein
MQSTTTKPVKKTEKDLYHHARKIKDALADTAEGIKGRAGDLVSELIEDLENRESAIQGKVEDYVKEKPLHSLGIATLVGIFIAKVIL